MHVVQRHILFGPVTSSWERQAALRRSPPLHGVSERSRHPHHCPHIDLYCSEILRRWQPEIVTRRLHTTWGVNPA